MYKPDERVVIKFSMVDKERLVEEGLGIESYHVILPNVKEKYYNGDGKLSILERELMIMMAESNEELEMLIKDNLELRKASDKIVEITKEEEANGIYDYEEQQRKIRNSIMASSMRKGYKKGYDEGMEHGVEKGIEQGIEQGLKMGSKESSIKIAKKLLLKGISKQEVSEISGLSIK